MEIMFVSIIITMLFISTSIVLVMAYRRKNSAFKNTQKDIHVLESSVASECREAFAELQKEKTDFTTDFKAESIPFLDYETYVMRTLFPNNNDRILQTNPPGGLLKEKELLLFKELVMDETFLILFIRTLESNRKFSMIDRIYVASLIPVALHSNMYYCTEILKILLTELIEKYTDGNEPKLLLRQTDSVAEKMLSSWFTILLYDFVQDCAGKSFYLLFRAMKEQVNMGPVDAITAEARYSLSEVNLFRQIIDFKPMTVRVSFKEYDNIGIKVLDCDTITQVKEKALDVIYRDRPYTKRPKKENLDVEWQIGNTHFGMRKILNDYDDTSRVEGEWTQMNTLQHYNIPDKAHLLLVPREINLTSHLDRTESPGMKSWHLVKQRFKNNQNKEKSSNGKIMMSEVYLTRLLTTKGVLQNFVDDLFQSIFSTNKPQKNDQTNNNIPLPIRYMFHFLDEQALKHNITDSEVVHIWKSNALPLRFWVNLIKNPDFVFDIHKSNIIDPCLSVIAQTFMDSCSKTRQKSDTTSKLLYAKDILAYKEMVDAYYSRMSPVSESQMKEMLTKESINNLKQTGGKTELKSNWALYELYKYAFHVDYRDHLIEALEKDKLSQEKGLAEKARKSFGLQDYTPSSNNSTIYSSLTSDPKRLLIGGKYGEEGRKKSGKNEREGGEGGKYVEEGRKKSGTKEREGGEGGKYEEEGMKKSGTNEREGGEGGKYGEEGRKKSGKNEREGGEGGKYGEEGRKKSWKNEREGGEGGKYGEEGMKKSGTNEREGGEGGKYGEGGMKKSGNK
ncbi:hypothetical protein WDU94_002116 [Cyamophila willieti]